MKDHFQWNISFKIIGVVILVFLVFITTLSSFFTIQPGQRWLLKTMGNISSKVYGDGFHLKIPFITSVVKMDITIQKSETDATSASKDLQNVSTRLAVNYSLDPAQLVAIYSNIGTEDQVSQKLIIPNIQEVVKATTAKFTAEELILKRQEVSDGFKEGLMKKLSEYWVVVQRVSITNFDFSKQFNDAIEAKVTTEQQALAEKNKLEIIKFQAQQKVEQAKWEAEARITNAAAEAEAIKIQTQAIQAQWWAEYVKLKFIERWDGVLPKISWLWWSLMNMNINDFIR